MQSKNEYENLWHRIQHVRFGMLTTRDLDDVTRARPMTTVQKEFDGTLWFFTSATADAAAAIHEHPQVGVQYADTDADFYASLVGIARVERDRARMEQFWSPMVGAWFPGGIEDPDVTLIRIDVHEAEYWDVRESKVSQMIKMVKAAIAGERPEHLGEHGKLNY